MLEPPFFASGRDVGSANDFSGGGDLELEGAGMLCGGSAVTEASVAVTVSGGGGAGFGDSAKAGTGCDDGAQAVDTAWHLPQRTCLPACSSGTSRIALHPVHENRSGIFVFLFRTYFGTLFTVRATKASMKFLL